MQLVIDFIFYLCAYSTCFERQAPIIRSPLTVYTASSFLCLCLSAALSCKKLIELFKDARIQKHQIHNFSFYSMFATLYVVIC
jgi:hypothetical protein